MAKTEETEVQKEVTIESINDYMLVNAQCTAEVVNDRKLSPMERLKGLNMGVRTQGILGREMRSRYEMRLKLGMNADGVTGALAFQPDE